MQAAVARPSPKVWTREEWHALEETGVLGDQRLELFEGELLDKMGQNRPHANAVAELMALMIEAFGLRHVRCQLPLEPSPSDSVHTLPVPDVAVVRQPNKSYPGHPGPTEVLLLFEVSDSTLEHDTGRKARMYARAGVPDYVVADVRFHRLFVFRQPEDGEYRWSAILGTEDEFRPLAAPDQAWKVRDLLGE